MKEITPEEKLATEALVRGGHSFFLENEIFTDTIINDLILYGFMADKLVVDVDLFIDEKEKVLKYVLSYNFLGYYLANPKKSTKKLEELIKAGLKEYKVVVEKKRYEKKEELDEFV